MSEIVRSKWNPTRIVNGKKEKWCTGCNQFLPIDNFWPRRKGESYIGRVHRCKECLIKPRVAHDGPTGLVLVSKVWHLYDEFVQRNGGEIGRASQKIGISEDGLRRILYKKTVRVQKRRVQKLLIELHAMRDANLWLKRSHPGGQVASYRKGHKCVGCGTDLDNYLVGCRTCIERRWGRIRADRTSPEGREAEKKRLRERRRIARLTKGE